MACFIRFVLLLFFGFFGVHVDIANVFDSLHSFVFVIDCRSALFGLSSVVGITLFRRL